MKNWKTKVISTALALSVLAPAASFASSSATTTTGDITFRKDFAHHQRFDGQADETKILEMVSKYTPESLDEWKNALARRDQLVKELKEKCPNDFNKTGLSDDVKAKIKTINEDVKNGKITREQAAEEFKKLGLENKRFDKQRTKMSDEDKEKINAIREDLKNGKITREQAAEEFKKLGLEGKIFIKQGPKMSEQDKEKINAIREDLKNGKITREQAAEEFKKLGLNVRKNFNRPDNLRAQFREAVKAGDENKIKELLPRMLQQLKERNQQLSDRVSKINQ